MLGRTLLFDKIYRHQKVRAIEMMFASLFVQIGALLSKEPTLFPYLLTDDEVLSLDEKRIRELAQVRLTSSRRMKVRVAADIADRMRRRDLFVRAFAFAQSMPLDPYRLETSQRLGLERLLRDSGNPETRGRLVRAISAEVTVILESLEENDVLERYQQPDLTPYIWLDPPRPASEAGDISRAYLISDDGSLMKFRDDFAQTRGWADAYLLTRDTGYIFCPRELAPFVYIASEKFMREEYGIRVPATMMEYSKQDKGKIDRIKAKLSTVGYFSASPHDIRPLPNRLTRADVSPRLDKIAMNLQGYNGPAGEPDKFGAGKIEAEHMLNWVRQFDTESHTDAALRVLEACKLIGRQELVSALRAFTGGNPLFKEASICPLGSAKDSSAINTYFAGDISADFGVSIAPLSEALATDGPVIFVDDFIGSGQQAISILEAWLGEDPTTNLGEKRGQPLSDRFRQALRDRPLGFVFSAGTDAGKANLEERAAGLGLNAATFIGIRDSHLPKAFGSGLFRSENQERTFKARCNEVGLALLSSAGRHAKERALGYGNDAYLIVFPYNTPSQTLTCLWASGSVGGSAWTPVFPRRKKT